MSNSVSLGSLLRVSGYYSAGIEATHSFDSVVADQDDVLDAKIMAGPDGDWPYYLIAILSSKERIPTTPYDPEQIDC